MNASSVYFNRCPRPAHQSYRFVYIQGPHPDPGIRQLDDLSSLCFVNKSLHIDPCLVAQLDHPSFMMIIAIVRIFVDKIPLAFSDGTHERIHRNVAQRYVFAVGQVRHLVAKIVLHISNISFLLRGTP